MPALHCSVNSPLFLLLQYHCKLEVLAEAPEGFRYPESWLEADMAAYKAASWQIPKRVIHENTGWLLLHCTPVNRRLNPSHSVVVSS